MSDVRTVLSPAIWHALDAPSQDEQQQIKKLQGIEGIQLPLPIRPVTPMGLSPLSSLEEAPKLDVSTRSQLQPQLEEPRHVHYMYDIATLYLAVEELMRDYTVQLKEQVRVDSECLEHLSKEKIQKLQEHAREMATKQTWDTASFVFQYIASSASIVIGIGLVSTGAGAVAGGFMIAAGALGLTTRIMTDVGGWAAIAKYFTKSQEMQQKYALWIDLTASGVSLAISVTSVVSAYQAGALALNATNLAEKIARAISLSTTVAGAGTQIGSAHSKMKGAYLFADLKDIQEKNFLACQHLKRSSLEFTENNEAMQALTQQVKQMADASGNNVM